ncbi:MAG TPA: DUF1501 domain-containing protein [Gemmatimonadales bacterium]
MDRRLFVRASGTALLGFGLDPTLATGTFQPGQPAPRGRTLVCLFQRGAVDGLSMVVPYVEPNYYRARPSITIPPPGRPGGVIDLDGRFGLHPTLAPLAPLYRRRSMAVVHAVGSPSATRSHFDAQNYLESGTPDVKSTADGWLNRYLRQSAGLHAAPFRAVAWGSHLPRALQGGAPAVTADRLESMGFPAVERAPRDTIPYPASPLGHSLREIAQLIKGDLSLEIAFADVGGWDTHVNQGATAGPLALRLADLGGSLAAFANDLGERLADVVILTMSEFGRTVAENGAGGTDHGRATAMLILGGAVNGGRVLGDWPGIDPFARFPGRDLEVTTDFRDVFGEVLVRHLGATNLGAIFPGHTLDLGWLGALG